MQFNEPLVYSVFTGRPAEANAVVAVNVVGRNGLPVPSFPILEDLDHLVSRYAFAPLHPHFWRRLRNRRGRFPIGAGR